MFTYKVQVATFNVAKFYKITTCLQKTTICIGSLTDQISLKYFFEKIVIFGEGFYYYSESKFLLEVQTKMILK